MAATKRKRPRICKPALDIYCKHCGSRDVRRDADVRWNMVTQEWELCAVYDNATCEQCRGETKLVEQIIS